MLVQFSLMQCRSTIIYNTVPKHYYIYWGTFSYFYFSLFLMKSLPFVSCDHVFLVLLNVPEITFKVAVWRRCRVLFVLFCSCCVGLLFRYAWLTIARFYYGVLLFVLWCVLPC